VIKVPLFVNETEVGVVTITRTNAVLTQGIDGEQYEWVATGFLPDGDTRHACGKVLHAPRDGLWALVATACVEVPADLLDPR
jgi:hypothetical protein